MFNLYLIDGSIIKAVCENNKWYDVENNLIDTTKVVYGYKIIF